jgi:hypothetical protein
LVVVYHSFGRGAHHPNAVEAYASRQRHHCDPIKRYRDGLASERRQRYWIPSVRPACYSHARMEAAVWTAIAVLAATNLGSLFYLGARIDALGARIDAQGADLGGRIDAQGADLGGRIDAQGADLGSRIDAQGADLGSRIDAQGADLGGRIEALGSRLDARIDGLTERIDAQNARIDTLSVTMADHVRRHAG